MPDGETVRVRLLGPVDVIAGETVRPLSGLRRKAVLATLALHAGEVVSTDRLADIVWGEHAPSTAVNTLQSHVSHLRTVLGSKTAIRGTPPGYVLSADEVDTDVSIAERLLRTASTAARPGRTPPGSCGRRWRCGAASRSPTSRGSPGSKVRRNGSICSASGSSAR